MPYNTTCHGDTWQNVHFCRTVTPLLSFKASLYFDSKENLSFGCFCGFSLLSKYLISCPMKPQQHTVSTLECPCWQPSSMHIVLLQSGCFSFLKHLFGESNFNVCSLDSFQIIIKNITKWDQPFSSTISKSGIFNLHELL